MRHHYRKIRRHVLHWLSQRGWYTYKRAIHINILGGKPK